LGSIISFNNNYTNPNSAVSDLYPTLSLGEQTPTPNDLDQNIIVPPLQSFSQWSTSTGSNINDPLLGAQGYADYQRGHFFRTGELDDQVESSISQGLVGSLLNSGAVDAEQVQSEDFIKTIKPQPDAQTQTNLIRMAYGEEAGSTYFNNIQSEDGDKEELAKQLSRAKSLLVESGNLPFARITDDKGVEKIIGGTGIEDRGKALDDAVRLGALDYSDAYRVVSGLKKGATENTTVFESIRQAKLLQELNGILGSKDPADDTAQNALDIMRGLVKERDIKPDLDQSSAMGAAIGDFRKGLSSAYSRNNGFGEGAALNRYSDKEIKDATELLAANEVNERGEFKFYDDEDVKNIRILGSGHVLAHPSLMQQKDRFERAVKGDKRLTPDQATSLRNQRKLFRQLTYEHYDKFLADTSATSDDWMAAKQAGRVNGSADTDVLDTFLADKRNYSSVKNRLGDVAATIPDAVIGMFASLGAIVFKSEGATNYLVENQKDRQRRREVASLFGDDFGWGMDLSNVVAPMVVDVTATALLSATTAGAGGVAYATTKAGAMSAAKLAVKNLSKVAAGRQFGDTAKDIAIAAAARKKLKSSAEKASFDGVQEALKAYNKAVGNKIFRKAAVYPPLFLTAANRSAGSTYATVYGAQPDNMTHEEKHDAALGYAMMAGTVTGLITSAFMGIGYGGFESAFLRGMTTKGMVNGLKKIRNISVRGLGATEFKEAILKVTTKEMQTALKNRVGNNLKAYGIPAVSEALEEGLDEFVQTFIMDAALNENTPMIERMMTGLHAASLGGVMGGGVVGVRNMMDRGSGTRYEKHQNEMIDKVIEELGASGSPLTQAFIEESKDDITKQLRTASRSREILDVTPASLNPDEITDAYSEYESGQITEEEFLKKSQGATLEEAKGEILSSGGTIAFADKQRAKEMFEQEVSEKLNSEGLNKQEQEIILKESGRETQAGSLTETELEAELEQKRQEAAGTQERFTGSFGNLWQDREVSEEQGGGLTAEEHHQRYVEAKIQAAEIASFWGMDIREDHDATVSSTREAAAARAKGAFRAEPTEEGMRLVINPHGLARLTMGLNAGNAQHVTRFEAAHEVIHHAAWRNLSKAEVDTIFSSLPKQQVYDIIDTYYKGKPELIAEARTELSPEALSWARRNQQHIVVDEFLRMKAQRITKGFTTEEEIDFYKSNPNFVRVLLRYLRSYVNRFKAMREKDSSNPVVGAALDRLSGEMTRLKGGFEVNTTIKFDIDDPESSLRSLATWIDDKPFAETDQRETQAGALDAKYLELAKDPEANQDELQKTVDETAKKAGYTVGPVFHGTPNEFTTFDYGKIDSGTGFAFGLGFYFAGNRNMADGYRVIGDYNKGAVHSAHLKINNAIPYDTPALSPEELLPVLREIADTELQEIRKDYPEATDMDTTLGNYGGLETAADMLSNGNETIAEQTGELFNSGVAAKNVLEAFKKITGIDAFYSNTRGDKGITVVFTPEQIKLSDPITKDDNGNVIPLSERFDLTSPDIRHTQAGALEGFDRVDQVDLNNDEEIKEVLGVNDAELAQTGKPLILPSGKPSAAKTVLSRANLLKFTRRMFNERRRKHNDIREKADEAGGLPIAELRPDMFAHTPAATLKLMEHPEVAGWHSYMREFLIPSDVDTVVCVPCAVSKNFSYLQTPNIPKGHIYYAYNEALKMFDKGAISKKYGKVYFITISEPLGVIPQDLWHDFPIYDNSGLFRDAAAQAGGMFNEHWLKLLKKYGGNGKVQSLPFHVPSYDKAIYGLGDVIAGFAKTNRQKNPNLKFVSFVKDAGNHVSTHEDMLNKASEIYGGIIVPPEAAFGKRDASRNTPLDIIKKELGLRRGEFEYRKDLKVDRLKVAKKMSEAKRAAEDSGVRYTQAGGLDAGGKETFDTDTGGVTYGSYKPLFDVPFFRSGEYKGKSSKHGMLGWLVNKFTGAIDPRVKRLLEQRRYIRDAVEVDFNLFKQELDRIVDEDFEGRAPVGLIQDITGSRENITPETEQGFEDNLKARRIEVNTDKDGNLMPEDQQRDLTKDEVKAVRRWYLAGRRADFLKKRSKAVERLAEIQKFKGDPYDTQLVKHLIELRRLTDEHSERIRDIVGSDNEMSIAIDDNLQIYLHKTYRLFSDEDYKKDIQIPKGKYADARNAAGNFLLKQIKLFNPKGWVAEMGSSSEAEFKDQLVNDYLDLQLKPKGKAAGSNLIAGLQNRDRQRHLINWDVGALQRRKNPPKELRELLGEVSDETGYNELLKTFQHLGALSSHINFINNLKKVGEDHKFIVEGEHIGEDKKGDPMYKEDSDPTLVKLEVLAGREVGLIHGAPFADGKTYFVNAEMDGVVSDILNPKTKEVVGEAEESALFINKVGATLTGLSLGAKTLGSLGFYVRNIVSNIVFFGPSQGLIGPRSLKRMGRAVLQERIRKKYLMMGKEEVSAFHRTLIMLGIGTNALEARLVQDLITKPKTDEQIKQELIDTLEGLETEVKKSKDPLDWTSDHIPKGVKKGYKYLRELSQSVDTFYKIAYFMNELDVMQQARDKHVDSTDPKADEEKGHINWGNKSDAELMQEAARKVKETSQQYDQAPPWVQSLNGTFFGVMFAPFIRFKVEVWRIAINTVALIKEEKNSGNPVLIKRGKQRAYGFWGTTIGASAIAPIIANTIVGIGEEEDEALRASMPEYLRSHSFFYFGKGDKLKSIDFTYLNPYAMIVDPFMRGLEQVWRGSPAEGGAALFKALVMEQYLDEQILAGAVSSALNNRDPQTGQPIVEANDTAYEAFSKKLMFVFGEAYAPKSPTAFVKEGMLKLMEGDPDVSDFIITPVGAVVNELMPMKPYNIKLEQQLDRFLSERSGEYRRASSLKNRMYTEDALSEGMIRGFTDTEIEKRRRINAHLLKTFRGFKKLGLTDEQIYNQALERGYGKRRMALLLNGFMERPSLQTPFIKNMAVKGDAHVERLRTYQNQLESYGRYIPVE